MSERSTAAAVMTPAEAAAYLGIRVTTLEVWRRTGRYAIAFVRVGDLVRYRRQDLDAWLESRAVRRSHRGVSPA